MLGSDNVEAKHGEEFDGFGYSPSPGGKRTVTTTWKRITGGSSSESLNHPTAAELQSLRANGVEPTKSSKVDQTLKPEELRVAHDSGKNNLHRLMPWLWNAHVGSSGEGANRTVDGSGRAA
jgi:hypothetical protein